MDFLQSVFIHPHMDLYKYGTAAAGTPMPFVVWPSVVLSVVGTYLVLVKVLLPAFMANRKPYNLRGILLTYNFLQFFVNLWMGVMMAIEMLPQGDIYFTGCMRSTPMLVRLNQIWILNKYCDLLETVFFVLRRKYKQVTFLHVYHHIIVIYYALMSYAEQPGGYQGLSGLMNCFVHAIMYGYYFASIYDRVWVQSFMDYKRRITQVQMVQFCVNMLWFAKPWLGQCTFPKYLAVSGCVQNGVLFYLFGNFYYHTYVKRKGTSGKIA